MQPPGKESKSENLPLATVVDSKTVEFVGSGYSARIRSWHVVDGEGCLARLAYGPSFARGMYCRTPDQCERHDHHRPEGILIDFRMTDGRPVDGTYSSGRAYSTKRPTQGHKRSCTEDDRLRRETQLEDVRLRGGASHAAGETGSRIRTEEFATSDGFVVAGAKSNGATTPHVNGLLAETVPATNECASRGAEPTQDDLCDDCEDTAREACPTCARGSKAAACCNTPPSCDAEICSEELLCDWTSAHECNCTERIGPTIKKALDWGAISGYSKRLPRVVLLICAGTPRAHDMASVLYQEWQLFPMPMEIKVCALTQNVVTGETRLNEIIDAGVVIGFFACPVCNTTGAVRCGPGFPLQLRSPDSPMGMPHISGPLRDLLDTSNELFEVCARLATRASNQATPAAVATEQPAFMGPGSRLWGDLPYHLKTLKRPALYWVYGAVH